MIKPSLAVAALAGTLVLLSFSGLSLPGPDLRATAAKLVGQCAAVKANELVLITGKPTDQELLELIAVEVRKVGAFPLISVASDKLARRMVDEVPASFDSQVDDFALKLNGLVHATISVGYEDNPSAMADVPPARMAAMAKARQPLAELALKRGIRQVMLGNGLYPSVGTAKMYGMTLDQLGTLFWAGVNTDYGRLQASGEAVQALLAKGKDVHITNANGTDLKFKIGAQPVHVSDGVVSAADAKQGGASCQVWLPAGEVYTPVVAGSAEGKLVADRLFYLGKEILGLTLTFSGGKITALTAKSGLEPLKAAYDAGDAGKDALGYLDLGINPDVKVPAESKLLAWMPAGMVTVGIGGNVWAGGSNMSSFELPVFQPGSTVAVDGKTLVEKGVLKP